MSAEELPKRKPSEIAVEIASFDLPGGESTSAQLRRVEQERDEARACWSAAEQDLTAVRAERDQLSNAVAGWVARFHAAHEALYIEEFDGDSCPDLESTIEYALGAYRRVCASEAAAADQIDSLRAELASADKIAAELRLVTRERDSLARRCAVRFQETQAVKAELASALIELEQLRAQLTKRQGEAT